MLRSKTKLYKDQDQDFLWRGKDVTRLENLSDIVFALSLGLLVSGGQIPHTYHELLSHMGNIPAVAFAMAILLLIWNFHFIYFRRYGLEDQHTIFLNAILLFLVLTFAHPLKFMTDVMMAGIYAMFGRHEAFAQIQINFNDTGNLLGIYSVIYFCIFMVVFLMYRHALKCKERLELTAKEQDLTKDAMQKCLMQAVFGIAAAGLALLSPLGPLAGMIYMLIWPTVWVMEKRQARKIKAVPKPLK